MEDMARTEEGLSGKESAYQTLVREVLSGDLAPGASLAERALVKRFGISRTPIREIMWQLERDGLIVLHPNRGAFVKQLGVEEVIELFQIRIALEPLACMLAAARRPNGELLILKKKFQDTEDTESSPKELTLLGEQLHEAIARWSGNRMLIKFYDSLKMQARLMRNLLHGSYSLENISFSEHQKILQAIEDQNGTLARKSMIEHLSRAQAAIMQDLFGPNLSDELIEQ